MCYKRKKFKLFYADKARREYAKNNLRLALSEFALIVLANLVAASLLYALRQQHATRFPRLLLLQCLTKTHKNN